MKNTNNVTLVGKIETEFKFNYEVFGQNFYTAKLAVDRLSSNVDHIIITVPEKLIDLDQSYYGKYICVHGEFHSYNSRKNGKTKLLLSVSVSSFEFVDENCDLHARNQIELGGYICKAPVLRKTPMGKIVADVLIASNRPHNRTDYIPSICWEAAAGYVNTLPVGTEVKVMGRIQSREYIKKLSETETEVRTAYEVSISKLEVIVDECE